MDPFDFGGAADSGCWMSEWEDIHGEPGEVIPPDREAKPYGWGIEKFEDPALDRANAVVRDRIARRNQATYTSAGSFLETWGIFAGRPTYPKATAEDLEFRDLCLRVWSTHNAALLRMSERVWDCLCDCCESHEEAVRRYSAWATRKTGVVV